MFVFQRQCGKLKLKRKMFRVFVVWMQEKKKEQRHKYQSHDSQMVLMVNLVEVEISQCILIPVGGVGLFA